MSSRARAEAVSNANSESILQKGQEMFNQGLSYIESVTIGTGTTSTSEANSSTDTSTSPNKDMSSEESVVPAKSPEQLEQDGKVDGMNQRSTEDFLRDQYSSEGGVVGKNINEEK